jgi:hypothetical protein
MQLNHGSMFAPQTAQNRIVDDPQSGTNFKKIFIQFKPCFSSIPHQREKKFFAHDKVFARLYDCDVEFPRQTNVTPQVSMIWATVDEAGR